MNCRRLLPTRTNPAERKALPLLVLVGFSRSLRAYASDYESEALADELAGIRLETTYTAKCLAALLDTAAGDDYRGRNLLFWNTYSSVDPGARVSLPAPGELPVAFHQYFDPS